MHRRKHCVHLAALMLAVLPAAGPVRADVVSYEATSFPDEEGWERNTFCTPERWIQDGWLQQDVGPAECAEPPIGDRDSYTRSLADFDGEPTFFMEWRVQVDGDSSEFAWAAPAVFAAWSLGPVCYWFAIARDQVLFTRDIDFAVVLFVDIAPDVPHTYRLELYGDQWYYWYIDGVVVHADAPGGPYPDFIPSMGWRAKSAFLESTMKWDYIRYGTIPADGSGDYDSDGAVDQDDYYFFHECLSNSGPEIDSGPGCRFTDFDFDGDTDMLDFTAFQDAFTGGSR